MQTSLETRKLARALAIAQGEFGEIPKAGRNQHLGYTYATLADVLSAVRKPLAANRLAIVQAPGEIRLDGPQGSGFFRLTTRLTHASGDWYEEEMTFPIFPQKGLSPAQTFGVAITYARRYALMAMLGVASQDDDTDAAEDGPRDDSARTRSQIREERTAPAPPPEKTGASAEVRVALEHFKANLLLSTTPRDVSMCMHGLLTALPGFNETKHWPKITAMANERRQILANRPPPAPPEDHTPQESDRKAIEGDRAEDGSMASGNGATAFLGLAEPSEGHDGAASDQNEPTFDPNTGEILDPPIVADDPGPGEGQSGG